MAFRLAYQISCNVKKPAFFGNSSVECIRRFRSISPSLESCCEETPKNSQQGDSYTDLRRRAHSYPSRDVFGGANEAYQVSNRGRSRRLSTDRDKEDEEQEEEEDETEDDRYDYYKNYTSRTSPMHQIARNEPKQASSMSKLKNKFEYNEETPNISKRRKSVASINRDAEERVHQYFLKDSRPYETKKKVFDVIEYYTEQYRWKDTKVLPHLQPHNLKPYGTGENLIFPVQMAKKNEIKYPITEPGYTEQVIQNRRKGSRSSDDSYYSNQERDFSTFRSFYKAPYKASDNQTDQPLEKKGLEHATGKDDKTSPPKSAAQSLTEYRQKISNASLEKSSSDELKKCDQLISDYKKLNPDYKTPTKEILSGSQEEQHAVNAALDFATNYRKFYQNRLKKFDTPNNNSNLTLKGKAVSETQVGEHHEVLNVPENNPELNRNSINKPIMERRKFSFDDNVLNLPEVPVTILPVRVGPKANLLQSGAFPEVAASWDTLKVDENVRLISPWPSYADKFKNQLSAKRSPIEITYPSQISSEKAMKNSANLGIQSKLSTSKMYFSTRSLNGNENLDATTPFNRYVNHDGSLRPIQEMSLIQKFFASRLNNDKPLLDQKNKQPHFIKRDFCSTSEKGTACDEETVTKKRSTRENNPFCDSTEFDNPPTPTEFFRSNDCLCIEPKPPIDVPPLKRLNKKVVQEPVVICPVVEECPPRADAGLEIKEKKLPCIVPTDDCPCIEITMKEGCPLRRLKKRHVEEPQRKCPATITDCTERADKGLKVIRKCLPKIQPQECPCIEPPQLEDVPPLRKLKKIKIKEPQRVCPPEEICEVRADEGIVVKEKRLPWLPPSNCPCYEGPHLTDVPLVRLKKYKPQDTPRCCQVEDICEETERADEVCGYKVKSKELPALVLKADKNHLNARSYANTKKQKKQFKGTNVQVSHKRKFCLYSRMNDAWKMRRVVSAVNFTSQLRTYSKKSKYTQKNPDCCCIEPHYPEIAPKLKRLPKFKKTDTDWSKMNICTALGSNPRADDQLKAKKKRLPKLVPNKCPCIEVNFATKQPRLKRLDKFTKGDIDWVKMKQCLMKCRNPRADDNWKSKKKHLPKLNVGGCLCKDPLPVIDTEPLKRLPKFKKPDINWKAEKNCHIPKCKRADANLEIINKRLPKLAISKCPCIEPYLPSSAPKMKRLFKFDKPDVNWAETLACVKDRRNPRADDKLKDRKKILPIIKKSDCPCVEPGAIVDVQPLKRLPKFEKADTPWNIPVPRCAPRADDYTDPPVKKLPPLKLQACPCTEGFTGPTNGPEIKRLPKFKKDDIDWNKSRICVPKYRNPRADDNWKLSNKPLPKMRKGDCPCVDPTDIEDVEPLHRLPKIKKEDNQWTASDKCRPGDRNARADDFLKTKEKPLPRITASKCPCQDNEPVYNDRPPLKRLPRVEEEDGDLEWRVMRQCIEPKCHPRSDELLGYTVKKRKLPPILRSTNEKCYHTSSRISYPIYQSFRKGGSNRYFCTTHKLNKKTSSGAGKKTAKKCPKIGAKKKQGCPKLTMKGCKKPKDPPTCGSFAYKECTKQNSPYPSFSESCSLSPPDPYCDCKVVDLKFLQPKYPIISLGAIAKAPPPIQGRIDPNKEIMCVKKKLGIVHEGETKTCENFYSPNEEPSGMALLKLAEEKAEREAVEQGTSVEEIRQKATDEACCQNKAKTGRDGECPVVSIETCCIGEPPLSDPCKREEKEAITCPPPKPAAPTCPPPKLAARTCPPPKPAAPKCPPPKPAARTCPPPKPAAPTCPPPKPATSTCPPPKPAALVSASPSSCGQPKKPPSLWERICNYFRARPNCPMPGEWKKKKLREDAEKAAEAAGLRLCEKGQVCRPNPCMKKAADLCKKKAANPCKKKAADPCKKKAANPCKKKAADPCKKKAKDPCKSKKAPPIKTCKAPKPKTKPVEFKNCTRPPKAVCGGNGAGGGGEKQKPPTMKGASKVAVKKSPQNKKKPQSKTPPKQAAAKTTKNSETSQGAGKQAKRPIIPAKACASKTNKGSKTPEENGKKTKCKTSTSKCTPKKKDTKKAGSAKCKPPALKCASKVKKGSGKAKGNGKATFSVYSPSRLYNKNCIIKESKLNYSLLGRNQESSSGGKRGACGKQRDKKCSITKMSCAAPKEEKEECESAKTEEKLNFSETILKKIKARDMCEAYQAKASSVAKDFCASAKCKPPALKCASKVKKGNGKAKNSGKATFSIYSPSRLYNKDCIIKKSKLNFSLLCRNQESSSGGKRRACGKKGDKNKKTCPKPKQSCAAPQEEKEECESEKTEEKPELSALALKKIKSKEMCEAYQAKAKASSGSKAGAKDSCASKKEKPKDACASKESIPKESKAPKKPKKSKPKKPCAPKKATDESSAEKSTQSEPLSALALKKMKLKDMCEAFQAKSKDASGPKGKGSCASNKDKPKNPCAPKKAKSEDVVAKKAKPRKSGAPKKAKSQKSSAEKSAQSGSLSAFALKMMKLRDMCEAFQAKSEDSSGPKGESEGPCVAKKTEPKDSPKTCGKKNPRPSDDNSKFTKMFPPDMPDCEPPKRIRRDVSSASLKLQQLIPMDECRKAVSRKYIAEQPPCAIIIQEPGKETRSPCPPPSHITAIPHAEDECPPPSNITVIPQAEDECPPPSYSCESNAEEKPKQTKSSPKLEERKPQEEEAPSDGKCKKVKKAGECPPKARDGCDSTYVFVPCKPQEAPYPSFSECRPPFPQLKQDECYVARVRAKQTLALLKIGPPKRDSQEKCKKKGKDKQKGNKSNKKGSRSYSTMSLVARARAFHQPTQCRRSYSSNASNARWLKYSLLLNNIEKNLNNDDRRSTDALNQRLVAGIEEGIQKLESQDLDLSNNPYYQMLKVLQKLSEKDVYDFVDQEQPFNPFDQLKSDVTETVSYVCKLNPKIEKAPSLLDSDVYFEPRYVGILDAEAQREEEKLVEAFKNFCSRVCDESEATEVSYEESERIKTENMQKQLDELLEFSRNNE